MTMKGSGKISPEHVKPKVDTNRGRISMMGRVSPPLSYRPDKLISGQLMSKGLKTSTNLGLKKQLGDTRKYS